MLPFLIATVALAMLSSDEPRKPKPQRVVYVYERLVTEDQPIPYMVTDSIVVREVIIP